MPLSVQQFCKNKTRKENVCKRVFVFVLSSLSQHCKSLQMDSLGSPNALKGNPTQKLHDTAHCKVNNKAIS